MINTVLFDMGGTLEDIYSDAESKMAAAQGVLRILRSHGVDVRVDEDTYTYSGHVLELDEAVRTALLLEMPTRVLCKPTCRGLCPQCGQDLNINACSCQKDLPRRNPFSALASLLNEDEEV